MSGLHERKILHRDIKLSNFVVFRAGARIIINLADLGISVQLKDPSYNHLELIGTRGYMAPEMLLGSPYGLPSDVWALGVVLHTLLFNQRPFSNSDPEVSSMQIIYEPLDLTKNNNHELVSDKAKDLLHKLLTKNAT